MGFLSIQWAGPELRIMASPFLFVSCPGGLFFPFYAFRPETAFGKGSDSHQGHLDCLRLINCCMH